MKINKKLLTAFLAIATLSLIASASATVVMPTYTQTATTVTTGYTSVTFSVTYAEGTTGYNTNVNYQWLVDSVPTIQATANATGTLSFSTLNTLDVGYHTITFTDGNSTINFPLTVNSNPLIRATEAPESWMNLNLSNSTMQFVFVIVIIAVIGMVAVALVKKRW